MIQQYLEGQRIDLPTKRFHQLRERLSVAGLKKRYQTGDIIRHPGNVSFV
jgi:hypothetical protein